MLLENVKPPELLAAVLLRLLLVAILLKVFACLCQPALVFVFVKNLDSRGAHASEGLVLELGSVFDVPVSVLFDVHEGGVGVSGRVCAIAADTLHFSKP